MKLFNKCIEIVLKHEGGYVNDPDDWGGETNYGIAKRYFPNEDIKNLTIERAKELYYQHYWLPMNLEGIQNESAVLEIFDFGVNAGRGRAIKKAQELAGVLADGICGTVTTNAINSYKGDFVEDYKEKRRKYYRYIAGKRNNVKFLRGWLNRVEKCKFE